MWPLRAAYNAESYGFVTNEVVLTAAKSPRERTAYIVIPSEFFQLLELAFTGVEKSHAAAVGTYFYMDEVDNHWVFGIETMDAKFHTDLWPYIKSRVPPWVDLALRSAH